MARQAIAAEEEAERCRTAADVAAADTVTKDQGLAAMIQRLQRGELLARVGSLTVDRLGTIRTHDDSFHTETAIYPVGYKAYRLYFAPGERPGHHDDPRPADAAGAGGLAAGAGPATPGPAVRRALYCCQIESEPAGDDGGPVGPGPRDRPVFIVTVNGNSYRAARATDAWERATLVPLRERKRLKVHANEGQCDNVAEMFMACSYSIDGDYMFGVTVGPIARALESMAASLSLFNYNSRFMDLARHVRHNPSGCARAEAFRRRKKMSTAKVLRSAVEERDDADFLDPLNDNAIATMYAQLVKETADGCPRTVVKRSEIHNFGLFATRNINANDMVIEYVGELVRSQVGGGRGRREGRM